MPQADLARFLPTRAQLLADLPASVVVFLVALPLCMGIAIASGAPVASGLITGIVGGLIVGLLAGSPLQVSGPAAGLTVLVHELVQEFGIERLGIIVLLAGLLQVGFGWLRLGQWFRAVSPAVVQGMLAGIGVLIMASQFHVMVDDHPKQSGWENLISIPEAVVKGFPPPTLDTAEKRAAQRERISRMSDLHSRQSALQQGVHHLLAGRTDEVPPATPTQLEMQAISAEEESLITALHELAPLQRAIIDALHDYESDSDRLVIVDSALQAALRDIESGNIASAIVSQDRAEATLRTLRDSTKQHRWAATVGIVTIALLVGWQSIVARRVKYIPGALVAVILVTAAAKILDLPVLTVEIPDQLLDEIFLPNFAELRSALDWHILLAAAEIALIASAETLLCATAVDQMHRGPHTNYDRELMAQGVGNICCGVLRALPLSGVIVRSGANVKAGAQSRWSTIMHGLWLLVFVVGCTFVLRMIPTSTLAAILVLAGYHLVDWRSFLKLWRQDRLEALVFLGTVIAIVIGGLLTGVLTGIGLAVLRLVYEFSRLEIDVRPGDSGRHRILRLRGNATFLRLPFLAQALDSIPSDAELQLSVEDLDYIDRACLDLLQDWQREHEADGGKLIIDRDSLTARFWRRPRVHQTNGRALRHARELQTPI